VIAAQPAVPVVQNVTFGPSPMQIRCPNCQSNIVTQTYYSSGMMVWLIVLVLFILGWFFLIFWFFCWIPLLLSGLKDVHHVCPNCKHHCGEYRRL
jgi:DNA-directed RNA polymerase subunit RPC12/RpoP